MNDTNDMQMYIQPFPDEFLHICFCCSQQLEIEKL